MLNTTTNEKKGFTGIEILVVVVVIVLLAGGYWLLFTKPATAPTTTPTGSDTSPNIPSDWKIYTNSEHGFAFKYPPSWHFNSEASSNRIVGIWAEKIDGEAPGVVIFQHDAFSDIQIEEWWEDHIKDYGDYENWLNQTDRKVTQLSGYNAYFVQSSSEKGWYSRPFTSLYVLKQDKVYEISTNIAVESDLYKIYNQILSTYEFIDESSAIDTSDWKTYTNEKYGFSFKYPNLNDGCCNISGPLSGKSELAVVLADKSTVVEGTNKPFDGVGFYVAELGEKTFSKYLDEQKDSLLTNYREFTGNEPIPSEAEIMVGNNKGTLLKGYAWWGDMTYVQFPEEQKALVIVMIEESEGSFKYTFDQILSTFEFLD